MTVLRLLETCLDAKAWMLERSRQTLAPRAIDKTVQQQCGSHGVMQFRTRRRIELSQLPPYCAQRSIKIHDVDVDPAERDPRTTVGIRIVELRASTRDAAKSCGLQDLRQRIFEPLSPHQRLDVAGNHHIDELVWFPWCLSATRGVLRAAEQAAQELDHVVRGLRSAFSGVSPCAQMPSGGAALATP